MKNKTINIIYEEYIYLKIIIETVYMKNTFIRIINYYY